MKVQKNNNMRKRNLFNIIMILILIYEEVMFEIFTKQSCQNVFLKLLLIVNFSLIVTTIIMNFKEKTEKITLKIITIVVTLIYTCNFIYYMNFKNIISVYSLINGLQVTQFSNLIFDICLNNWYAIIGFCIPVILVFLITKKINLNKISKKYTIIQIIICMIIYVLSISIINLDKRQEIYSNKNLYYNVNNIPENLHHFGLITTIRLDLQRTIFRFKEKELYTYKNKEGQEKILDISKYNMLNIDFEKLKNEENDEEIKKIHEYIEKQEPSQKNKYTGKYKDKNLIVIVAESFSSLAINEELTPTLYRLRNQGFQFENYYTPLFFIGTADGEYVLDNSLIPAEGKWSMEEAIGKEWPYSYANILKNKNYKTYAYHNYNYDYYKRNEYLMTTGYEKYLAKGNGLEERMDLSESPSSDYEMMKATIDDYINEEKFLAYYVTMSGHMSYNMSNAMVAKNWDRVKDLQYSDKAKSYLATQIELDKAVEELINRLKEKDRLKDTIILIAGDHYPYGLTENEIKELSPYNMDEYNIEKYHMPLIIYNGEENDKDIKINTYASSLDVLPTMLNLFGIEYDSRLLMGRDIFSKSDDLVIFANRSFISSEIMYNSEKEKITMKSGETVDEEKVKKIKNEIYLKYKYSRLILEKNYYKKIFQEIKQ